MAERKEKYELQNVTQELVAELLPQVVEEVGVCDCEKCRLDIMALALNELPSRYKVMESGYIMQRFMGSTPQGKTSILEALYRAAMKVKENPMH